MITAARSYERYRADDNELWKRCFGKEVLRDIAPRLGLRSADAVETRIVRLWDGGDLARPEDVEATRAYIEAIGTD